MNKIEKIYVVSLAYLYITSKNMFNKIYKIILEDLNNLLDL